MPCLSVSVPALSHPVRVTLSVSLSRLRAHAALSFSCTCFLLPSPPSCLHSDTRKNTHHRAQWKEFQSHWRHTHVLASCCMPCTRRSPPLPPSTRARTHTETYAAHACARAHTHARTRTRMHARTSVHRHPLSFASTFSHLLILCHLPIYTSYALTHSLIYTHTCISDTLRRELLQERPSAERVEVLDGIGTNSQKYSLYFFYIATVLGH